MSLTYAVPLNKQCAASGHMLLPLFQLKHHNVSQTQTGQDVTWPKVE